MGKQEAFLSNDDLGDSLDSAEALLKKHNDFETSLAAQDVKFSLLDEFAKVRLSSATAQWLNEPSTLWYFVQRVTTRDLM